MKKANETLTVIGFSKDDGYGGVIRFSPVDRYEPFEKKGKLGVRYKTDKRIVIEPEYTYVEAIVSNLDVFFIVGKDGKYGLYKLPYELIPTQYVRVTEISDTPLIFLAYTNAELNQFDVYWNSGLLAKDCNECSINNFRVKVKYIDETQELFGFVGNYETKTIIEKGEYDIICYAEHVVVDDGKPIVYNYKGCKVSEDASGKYVWYGFYLIHVTETSKKFYDEAGKEVDLYKTYEDVVMADEYVLVKSRGHWNLIYSV